MAQFFGLPIFVGMILGIAFPFAAVEASTMAVFFLIVLMISAGLSVNWENIQHIPSRLRETIIGLVFGFIVFPLLLYVPAYYLLTDDQFLYGFVFSSLCPIAMVAPYFSRIHNGDSEYAMILVVASMVLCPLLAPFVLSYSFSTSAALNLLPLVRYMTLLIILPTIIGFLITRFLPRLRIIISRFEGLVNSLILGLLVFSLFGNAVGKLNTAYTETEEILGLIFLVFLQDFGVLFICRYFISVLLKPGVTNALIIGLSMKNVAIAAGVLLIYDPRASFAPAVAFVAHGFLFSFLAIPRISSWLFKLK